MFNKKEYLKKYYKENKKRILIQCKENYIKNIDHIKARVKKRRENETPEKREKRLAFHKEYNSRSEVIAKKREREQTDEKKYLHGYKNPAKKRGYSFKLTYDEFKTIFHGKCDYCGEEDARGIDRVDNNIGYIKENSVPCCEMCNKMKWRLDKKEFLKQIDKIFNKPRL